MKKLLLFALFCLPLLGSVYGQQTVSLFTENFEGATSAFALNTSDVSSNTNGFNDWVVNNSYTGGSGTIICLGFPFTITVANTPNQPVGVTGAPNSNYLHILADDGVANNILNANYRPADGTCTQAENNFAAMNTDINTLGYINVDFSFYWMHGGSAATVGELYYSTNSGTSWTQLTAPITNYQNQSTWTQQSVTNPVFDNQATLRFGFRLANSVSTAGAEPSFSIDQIEITGEVSCTPSFVNATATICQGDSILLGGVFQTMAGTYVDSLVNAASCDSIITTTLTVDPGANVNASAAICVGDTITLGGQIQSSAGVYTDVYQTANGCDSIVVTTLTVNPTYNIQTFTSICDGDSILLGGGFQTMAGIYNDILTTGEGCDSTVQTTLTVNPTYNQSATAEICPGDSILLGGAFQSMAGVYTDQFTADGGCDSIVVTTLTVSAVDTSVSLSGETLMSNASNASYQWIDCDQNAAVPGETSQSFAPTLSGNYAVVVTQGNCSDTSACQFVSIVGTLEPGLASSVALFPNPVKSSLQVDLGSWYKDVQIVLFDVTGKQLLQEQLGGEARFELEMSHLPQGLYFLRLFADGEGATFRLHKQ